MKKNRGFTLVELLVATAITMLLVLAVTQAFSVISSIITNNRASLEMSGVLRTTATRVQHDLDRLTAPLNPWLDSSAGLGYFEYIEGPANDFDADNDGVAIPRHSLYEQGTGASPVRILDAMQTVGGVAANAAAGDADDVISFTIRAGDEPFVGQVLGTLVFDATTNQYDLIYDPAQPTISTIESNAAEVVWFTWRQYTDVNGSGAWENGEPFQLTLYRRLFLIRPDINLDVTPGMDVLEILDEGNSNSQMPYAFFASANDLSVRHVPLGGTVYRRVCNSLADLTLRGNRFARGPGSAFPHELEGARLRPKSNVFQPGADGEWGNPGDDDGVNGANNLGEAGWPGSDDVLIRASFGEDVVQSNLLAFDVKAFDPFAMIRVYFGEDRRWGIAGVDDNGNGTIDDPFEAGAPGSDDVTALPGEPGFVFLTDLTNSTTTTVPVGSGGYVDLGAYYSSSAAGGAFPDAGTAWVRPGSGYQTLSNPLPSPNPPSLLRLQLPTYDTWPLDYERDGVNQDVNRRGWLSGGSNEIWRGRTDQGTDGIDNDGANGIDDVYERETQPPYPVKLRGLQIKLRIYDPDSKLVKQSTVTSNFVKN